MEEKSEEEAGGDISKLGILCGDYRFRINSTIPDRIH
jgi:hypothetical protein